MSLTTKLGSCFKKFSLKDTDSRKKAKNIMLACNACYVLVKGGSYGYTGSYYFHNAYSRTLTSRNWHCCCNLHTKHAKITITYILCAPDTNPLIKETFVPVALHQKNILSYTKWMGTR